MTINFGSFFLDFGTGFFEFEGGFGGGDFWGACGQASHVMMQGVRPKFFSVLY